MKKLLLLAFVQLFCFRLAAQSCCEKASVDFQLLAVNDDFQASHLSPVPFNFAPDEHSAMISFATDDGKDGHAYYVPSDEPTSNVLIIFHEWWGLNDYIKKEAERWQQQLGNVDVYAIDLYDGQVATEAKDASRLSQALSQERGEILVKGLIAKIGQAKRVSTLGWCMGGSWSFTAARMLGDKANGCVMYYGFPEQDEKKVKQINTDVLYVYGTKDNFITKDAVDVFEKTVLATGHKFERHNYDAVHAFANPSNPNFAAREAKEAEVFVMEFLKKRMQL